MPMNVAADGYSTNGAIGRRAAARQTAHGRGHVDHVGQGANMGDAHEPGPPIGDRPMRVQVLIGREWIDATAHGRRTGSHGTQLLIFHAGRYTWIHTDRVRPNPD
jgi:hypothetical protein